MSGDAKRSILGDLKRPLIQPASAVSSELEERLLGSTGAAGAAAAPVHPEEAPVQQDGPGGRSRRGSKARVPTVPVTFHLPVELRDRIKITSQAKQKTMLEIAIDAFQDYLERNPVSEADLRRLLGL